MRYLWFISILMVALGIILAAIGAAGLLEPIALLFGILLLWSGVVKLIVLRIWRSSLNSAPVSPHPERSVTARGSTR